MWGQIAGAALGAIGGSKGSKSSGGMPKFVKKQFKRGFGNLNTATDRPVGEAIAPQNADQLNAMQAVRNAQGLGGSDINLALSRMRAAGGGVTPEGINKFFNPFTSNVIDASIGDIERARGRAMLGINSEAEAARAFGGDREAVAKALAAEDFNRNIATTSANLRYGGWNSALDAAFRDNEAIMSGAGNLLEGVGRQRGAAYDDATALAAVGDTQYGYDQSLLDYPLKMAQLQVDAASGAGGATRATAGTGGGLSGAMAGAVGGYNMFGGIDWSKIGSILKGV